MALVVAGAGYRAAVRNGHARLESVEHDLKILDLAEVQIHDILIPDLADVVHATSRTAGVPGNFVLTTPESARRDDLFLDEPSVRHSGTPGELFVVKPRA